MQYLNYFTSLRGRIGRGHFWILLVLSGVLVATAAIIGSLNLGNQPVQWFAYLILLASCLPMASATFRRLQDLDFTAKQMWLFFIATVLLQILAFLVAEAMPLLGALAGAISLALFVMLGIRKGTAGANRYGPGES